MSFLELLSLVFLATMLWCTLTIDWRQGRREQRILRRLGTSDRSVHRHMKPPGFRFWKVAWSLSVLLTVWLGRSALQGWGPAGDAIAVALLVYGCHGLFTNLEGDFIVDVEPGPGRAVIASLLLVGLLGSGWTASNLHSRSVERHRQEQNQARAADAIAEARRPWQPGRGVAQAEMGEVLAWVAVEPDIWIDWQHEKTQDQDGNAYRRIPIDVTVLNNAFRDTLLMSTGDPLWTLILDAGVGSATRTFTGPLREDPPLLFPAERIVASIDWDGRDGNGKLVGPGSYTLRLETLPIASTQHGVNLVTSVRLADIGPEKVVVRDAVGEYVEHRRQMAEWQKTMETMSHQLDEMIRWQHQMNQLQYRPGPFWR